MGYVHGTDALIHVLEAALAGCVAGDTVRVSAPPDVAYGEYYDERIIELDRDAIDDPDDVAVNDELLITTEEGEILATVVGVADDGLTVDTNHPLAGRTLHFEATVLQVRDATAADRRAAACPAHGGGCSGDHG
jgi:FKBP-type peptidyl-prolyl cis-trans isomerase SlyD